MAGGKIVNLIHTYVVLSWWSMEDLYVEYVIFCAFIANRGPDNIAKQRVGPTGIFLKSR
jgi:hypothetical protein